MAILLALGAAAFYGSADFVGGLAARRNAVLVVALGAQASGLVVLAAALPLLGPAQVATADLVFGALAGVFGGLGLVVIYRALAGGPMSVVAPTSALSAAVVPVLAGLALGERPAPTVLAGIGVALAAVVLITRERPEPGGPHERAALRTLLPALAGGGLFGLFFVLQHQTGAAAGLWPLLAARLTSVPLLALLVVHRRVPVGLGGGRRSLAAPVLLSGTLDMVANILFLVAARHGMLAVVSALTGLYPASTVVLAQARLGERLRPAQQLGLGVAVLAAALVAS